LEAVEKSIANIETHFGNDCEIVVSEQRYAFVHGAVKESVVRKRADRIQKSELVDMILLNRVIGLPVFLLILWSIFQLTFKLGEYPMAWLESLFGVLSSSLTNVMPEGLLRSLVVDGIIGGVGGVLSFVPLIVILFLCISILEDTGYMARAAFIMDKFLHIFGLHGQSFLPLMVGFGCSVPAIMASRALKSPRDRIVTVLVTPFMSCGAKLPVYILLTAAFFKDNAANVVMSMYIIGIAIALISARILRSTVLKGDATPFVMELPPYRMPTIKGIFFHVWDKTYQYLKKAGSVLLAASILIWAIVTFPIPAENEEKYRNMALQYEKTIDQVELQGEHEKESMTITLDELRQEKVDAYIETMKSEEALTHSIAGRIGKIIEPVVRPLGFDWKIGISAVTGFAAKEIVVSTLGVLYKVGQEESEESESLREALVNDVVFNPLVAFVLMLFTLIVTPCFAAQATIKGELGWKWLGFQVSYSILSAWVICFAVYQIGRIFGIGM